MEREPSSLGRISRRSAVGALAAVGAGAILWPGGSRDRVAVPRGRVELTYWEKWTGRERLALQRIVDRFNHSQNSSWVHLVPISDITSKAMVAIGGGDPPDVVGLFSYSVPGYAEAEAAIPLETFAQRGLPPIDWPSYLPAIRNLLWHEGRAWAGVNSCYTLALYGNRALFMEADLDPDLAPRTIAELDSLAAKLTVTGAEGRIERAGFLQNVPGWWPYFWPTMFGGNLFDAATSRATCATDACIDAFSWCGRTAGRFGVSATRAFAAGFGRSMHTADDPFFSGRQAMIVQGPWIANFVRELKPDLDYFVAPLPVPESLAHAASPVGQIEADVLMIPRGCRHPDEAYRFLLFMQQPEVQEELALAHAKPSPFLSVSPGFATAHPNRGLAVHEAIARSPAVQTLPRTRAWKSYADMLGSAFDAVWSGADAGAQLRQVQLRAQAAIDTLNSRRGTRSAGATPA
ncbi:MAG: extracellular solute-binding protein [Phycisphaerales bacterium]|nr:extracellular solute-binding protein [Phycisphaerales bacterium]